MTSGESTSLSLSQLLGQLEKTIKKEFSSSVWFMAEILELNVNRTGHCYLELIEKNQDNDTILAKARATIWASKFNMLSPFFETTAGMPLKNGIKILCRGTVGFHKIYGFSINITDIDPAYTLGDLARKKQEVIKRLRDEGVMDMNREIPFPTIPQRIAVISSETAAGYGDFMDSIRENSQHYHFHTRLFQAAMQGDEAPASIIKALDFVYSSNENFDCVVMIRGGGSRADLECFNNYDLAYYITQFPIPVVTGIGHERDESVADLVASFGLKTPTAVAEFLVEKLLSFEFRLSDYRDRLSMLVGQTVNQQRLRLGRLAGDLTHLSGGYLLRKRERCERLAGNLTHLSRGFVQRHQERLERSGDRVKKGSSTRIMREKERLSHLEAKNELVNPLNVLKRGYSMTLHQGTVLSGIEDIKPNETLETRLQNGTILSKVEKTISSHDKRED
ncbi:MAG: exodeoxyribonuclease VII large subunit [Bacteroidetes bacterium]|nr:exodeoxyribonuclease VII large subunit [Bacteroidota bacterium]